MLLVSILLLLTPSIDHTLIKVCFSSVDFDIEARQLDSVADVREARSSGSMCVIEVPCEKAELVISKNMKAERSFFVSASQETCKVSKH